MTDGGKGSHGRDRAPESGKRTGIKQPESRLQPGVRLLHRGVQVQYATWCRTTYIRKQTLANCERYITQELKELEEQISRRRASGSPRWSTELFCRGARPGGRGRLTAMQRTAQAVGARWTCCAPSPRWRSGSGYVPPEVDLFGRASRSRDGRHPVVEQMLNGHAVRAQRHHAGQRGKPGRDHHRPQHGGQIHLYAPGGADRPHGADAAALCRPKARTYRHRATGSSPGWARRTTWPAGQSTFMVEMSEVADILKNATGQQPADPGRDRPGHLHL